MYIFDKYSDIVYGLAYYAWFIFAAYLFFIISTLMLIFKKILSKKNDLFAAKKLVYTSPTYELYTYSKNNESFSLIKYSDKKDVARIVEMLRTIKHANIINIMKKKDCHIYTSLVAPYKMLGKDLPYKYREYLMISLARSLDFLHKKCKVTHNGLNLDVLFANKTGSLVLGGFERAAYMSTDNDCSGDLQMFGCICLDVLGRQVMYDELLNTENFYNMLSESFVTFNVMSDAMLIQLINTIRKEQMADCLPEMIKMYICELVSSKIMNLAKGKEIISEQDCFDIENQVRNGNIEHNMPLRYVLLYFVVFLELETYDVIIDSLFSVLDTKFRIEVLKKKHVFLEKITCWNKKSIFNNLIIGLKCKDRTLQSLTLDFINDTVKHYNGSKIKELCKLLANCKHMHALQVIDNNIDLLIEHDLQGVYKLMFVFVYEESTRNGALVLLSKIFKIFSHKKLSKEILPFLCELIIETNTETLFYTIRSILNHLESNRDEINSSKITSKVSCWLPFMNRKDDDKKEKHTPDKTVNNTTMDRNDNWDNNW